MSDDSPVAVIEVKGSGVFPEPEPRIFKPVKAYQFKLYVHVFLVFSLITFITSLVVVFFTFFTDDLTPEGMAASFGISVLELYWFVLIGYLFISILWIMPVLILIPVYISSFKYVVHGSEIVVHKGLINKSEKHVPFRTVTHVSSRAGILDRLLGIGTVEIQTAGVNVMKTGPEEKIEGIRVYQDVRDFIVRQLRDIKSKPLFLFAPDLPERSGKPREVLDEKTLTEMLELLKDIKELFEKK